MAQTKVLGLRLSFVDEILGILPLLPDFQLPRQDWAD